MLNKPIKYFLFSLCIFFISGNITFAQLNWNQAGKFNGPVTSPFTYLAIPNAAEFNNVDECMISMWVNMTTFTNSYYQFINKDDEYQLAYNGTTGLYARNANGDGNSDLDGPLLNTNRWYHIALIVRDTVVSGDASYKVRELYVDALVVNKDLQKYSGGTLGSSTDSLKIGSYGAPNFLGTHVGYLDDVQMWLGKFYPDDIARNFRTSLAGWGNANNYYYKCILSIPFQDEDNSGAPFQVADESRFNHTIKNNSVTTFSMSNRPSVTTYDNLSVHLNGSSDYLAAPDHTNNSPDVQLTMEAWVYPEKTYVGGFSDFGSIICKGFGSTNYKLFLGTGNSVYVTINGNSSFGYTGDVSAPANRWTHIAFTYNSSGAYFYYINGVLAGSGTNNQGSVINGTDSLYIGQSAGGSFFQGYIDEVRISAYAKDEATVQSFLNRGMDLSDRPGAFDLTCYNFDGGLANNNGGLPKMYFRNGAVFSSRYMSASKNFPVSPLVKCDNMNFPNGWYMSNTNLRIPESGTSGFSKYDTIDIPYCMEVSDVNVFLALNHTFEKDLVVYLMTPAGDSIEMVKTNVMNRGQFVTIFNDEADSSIINNRFATFSPQIKPFKKIDSTIVHDNSKGYWRLHVQDLFNGDTGMVYSWGLQFNGMSSKPNLMTCGVTANQSGFWGGASQVQDTLRYILHRNVAPYDALDSAIGYVNQFGFSTTYLANALSGSYYIEIKHRNSLAVWTNTPKTFTQGGSTSFNILSGPSSVYGSDLISVNGRWCMYSGDINQDGAINGNDFTAFNTQFGQSGYIASDLNGDNTVNGNDFTIFNTGFGHQTNHP